MDSQLDSATTDGFLILFDETDQIPVAFCDPTWPCETSVIGPEVGVHTYRAYVGSFDENYQPSDLQEQMSDPIQIDWVKAPVQLTADTAESSNGAPITFTASYPADMTWISGQLVIADAETGDVVASCEEGNVCEASVFADPGTHHFYAYVADLDTGATRDDISTPSDIVTAEWLPIALTVDLSTATPYELGLVTATAHAGTTVTDTPYTIVFTDTDTEQVVATCAEGDTCSTQFSFIDTAAHHFVAQVAAWDGTSVSHVQATIALPEITARVNTVTFQPHAQNEYYTGDVLIDMVSTVNLPDGSAAALRIANADDVDDDYGYGSCYSGGRCMLSVTAGEPKMVHLEAFISLDPSDGGGLYDGDGAPRNLLSTVATTTISFVASAPDTRIGACSDITEDADGHTSRTCVTEDDGGSGNTLTRRANSQHRTGSQAAQPRTDAPGDGPNSYPSPAYSPCNVGTPVYTRFQTCTSSALIVTHFEDYAPVSSLEFTLLSNLKTSASSGTWIDEETITDVEILLGEPTVTVAADFSCVTSTSTGEPDYCPIKFLDFPVLTPGLATTQTYTGTADKTALDTIPGKIGFTNPKITLGATIDDRITAPVSELRSIIRCDDASVDYPVSIGCVLPDPSLPPTFTVPASKYPEFAVHVSRAQASGLPGAPGDPNQLWRLTDPATRRANGLTACSPSIDRPTGKSCDEYPFRSTFQGAKFQADMGFGGRTFEGCNMPEGKPTESTGPNGWSACMIDKIQNHGAGVYLGSFYSRYRLLQVDAFWVNILSDS